MPSIGRSGGRGLIRSLLIFVIAAIGVYFIYNAGIYAGFVMKQRPDGMDALLEDIPFLLRFAGAFFLCAGSALALLGVRSARWMIALGAACISFLTLAIIFVGGDRSLWQDDAISSGVLILLTLLLFRLR